LENREANPLGKLIPALVILGMAPGFLEICIQLQRWLDGDHIGPLADGMNAWAAGRLVLSGHLDAVLNPWLPPPLVAGLRFRGWVYPPSMLLVAVPFGMLPPACGVLLFDALSLAILAFCLRAARFGRGLCAAILLCPAALDDLADSQNGALLAGLLIAGLRRSETSPWLGGVLLGLATIKPQLGLLIPVYLLARGNWRAIASAAGTAVILCLASALAFGARSWVDFASETVPYTASLLAFMTANAGNAPRAMLMSVFSLAREAGGSVHLAYAIQAISTAAVCAAAWLAARRIADQELRLAILLVTISLAPPYLWSYDMICGSLGIALLVRAGLNRGFYRGEFAALALLWITPGLAIYLAAQRLPGFCPLIAAAVLFHAWRHARADAATVLPGTG
jgi:hypothetical protein